MEVFRVPEEVAPAGSAKKRMLRSLLFGSLVACLAATGGAVAWDRMRPWSHDIDDALAAAPLVETNTSDSRGVAARLLDLAGSGARALRELERRGDREATNGLRALRWWIEQPEEGGVTVDQIRARHASMPPEAFAAWLKEALR